MKRLLEARNRKRLEHQIDSELPLMLTLTALMMRSGLDFQSALSRWVELAPPGPLLNAVRPRAEALRLGKPSLDVFCEWIERPETENLSLFAEAALQNLANGAPLAPALMSLAEEVQRERLNRAERKAAQAPLRMLIPLVALIFPTVLLTLFGPVAIRFLMPR